ncbi:uncharacterized protein LOC100203405 isoform X3 [Hydra vulgaris]|uniref:Uncharacterized protein LOC100203405 isoform X3 n=1 Tax=Hydra vulgaris TaxID=6087 RepID=A0ABM4CEY2_HYDVU
MINALILMICYANHVVSQKASEEFNFAGPILLQSSNLLYTFINFYEEYIVSFEINPMSIYQTEYGSVIHLTANGDYINYGDRNPAVFFNPAATQQGLLSISTSINGSIQNFNVKPLPLNEWSLVEILQEFVDSNFVLSISINKTKLYSSVNSQTIKQSNVKLYASNPWHSAQDGYIRNLYVFTSKTDFSGCINGDSTNLQLTASGYHVKSNISCISVCNSYSPPIFSDAFFLEGQLCFCRNASLPPFQISTTDTCVTSTCLNNNTTLDCSLTNFAFFSLSLGIIEWNIVFNPAVVFVDKEVEIQTNILKGNASNAFVVPLPNDLPLLFQNNVNNTIVKAQFYLPGLQIWSQTIGNAYTDPFNVTTWVQVDEDIGRVFVIPSTVQVNGFYNFFLVITQGTNISVKISLPMNKILSFTADLLRLSYGFDVSLLNTTTTKFCQLSDGYVLKQVVLTSGHFTKLMVKASTKGSLKIDILRPLLNTSADFCPFEFECAIASLSNESVTITAVVVKKFIFLLNSTGIIEILIQSSINDVQENDLVWIGGSASLFCNEEYYNKIQEIELGKTTLFSTDQMADGFFISLFISKSFECLIPIPASAIGLYNFTVDVYSHVSPIRRLYYLFPIQNPVSGLQFENQMPVLSDVAGYKINKYLYSKAVINGSDVTYLFIIPELNCSVNTTNTTAMFKMTSYGNFTVYLAAANKVNLINTSVNIVVLSEINSISMNIIEMQLQYSSYETVISINNGNRVQLTLDFGDETPVTTIQNIDATDVVVNFSIFHTYSKCSLDGFNVTATASNILVDSNTIINSSKSVFKIVIVFCKLSTLNIVPTPIVSQNGYVSISPNKNLLVTINQDYGSYRNYLINWGDGSTKWINQSDNQGPVSFQERHIYQTENRYIVSVTCRNLLDFSNNSIIVKVINCSMPGLSFYYGTILSPMNVIQSVGAELAAVVENPDSFCPKLSSIFQWNLTNSNLSQSTVGTQVQQKVTYTIQRNQLLFGLYNLTLTYKYGEETNIYIAYLNVTESPLLIVIDKGFFNSIAYKKTLGNSTLHQNFTISASSSFDRDDPTIGIQNITFMWRCKIASNLSDALDAMSNFTLLNLTYKSDTCFNETWVNVSFGNSKINFSTHQFLEGISYHIEVCGKKYAGKDVYSIDRYKEDCFTQKLYMVPRGLPILSTICVSNCDKKLNFKERVIYTFKCEDCGLQILEAQWDIADDAGNFPLELSVQNATTTGFHSPCLVLNKDILIESKNYTFVLIFGYADSSNRAKIKFTKSTCSKPKPGVCYANPAVGFALETKFNIICDNWKDSDGLLRYMFYYNNGQTQHMNVSTTDTIDYPILNAASTDQPSLFDFLMGPGDKNNDDQVTIIIKVSNKYQAYTEYKHLFIKVQPNDKPVNVTDLITGIDLNDTQSLANLVQAVSSTTNKMSANYSNSTLTTADNITGFIDNAALNQEKQRQLSLLQDTRTHMIGLLNNATINDLNSFKTIGDALALTSQNPIELVSQSQKQASNIVAKMSELLTIQNLKNIGADKFDTMTQPFLKSISNLFQTSLNNNESDSVLPTLQTTTSSTTSSLNLESNNNPVLQLFKSMDNHFMAAQTYKVPGENATVGETNQFTFVLKKDFSSSLSNKSIGSSDGEYGFTLPDSKDLFNDSVQNSQISVNNLRMKDNAYTWDTNRSQNILSESQSLSFSDANGHPIKVSNSSQPIKIAIKNIPEKMTGKNISLSMPNGVSLISLPLTSGCNMLLKFLFLNDENNLTNLFVYIQYGKIATKLDHDIMLNISYKYGVIMTKNNNLTTGNITFDNNLNDLSNFSGSVQRNQDALLLDDGTLILWNFLNSTYGFYKKSILHLLFSYSGPMPSKKLELNPYTFDEAESVGTYVYEMKSFCAECNYWNEGENKWMSDGCELDINGTSFLVTKCKCTHLTSFGGFFVAPNPIRKPTLSMLKNGYVLTVAVAIALFIWIIGLIFCRRMDKKDVSKIGVSPLLDNRDEDNYMYQLIVYTGNRKDAGTESNIFFTVAGDMGDSEVRRLKGSERKCFQRSSCDMFIMTTQSSLGDLDYIRFWHDNSGGGWYIKNIIIIDLQTEKQYLFIGNRWLAVDRGSYSVDCVLPAASVEEQNDFTYIFTSKAKHNLSDEHLWFSVLARSPKSNFTRCQRLSVAVSLLLTSMMVSAMFYGLGEGKQDPATENKSVFSFTRTQISVVLICTFIKFPVHLLLVKFFRSIKPFQISNDKNDSSCDKSGGWKSPTLSDKCNSLSSNQKLTEIIVEKNVSLKKKKFLLPHCYLFVAWFFCVVNILGSAVVVLFYGMSFGNKTSLNWLATVTIDLVKEVFFTEPIKLFVLAVFFALFIKNIKEEETDFQTQGKMLALDESWLHKPKHEPSIFDRKDIEMQPLNTSMVLEMRDLRIKNLKMYSLFKELALYIFYAILVMFIGYSTRKNVAFRQTRNVQDLFNLTLRRVPWPRDYSKIYGQIQATPDFWNWMDEFFLRQVFPEPWYKLSDFYANSDKKDFPGKLFLNDLNSKIVNGIRIRQVRVQPNSCVKTKSVAQFIKVNCMSSYTSTLEETGNFYLNWTVPLLHNSDINPLTKPWRYQTWKELDGYPYAAKLETYYGGGYVVEIFPKWKNKAIIDQVKKLRWIDRQTRAILIEFALFNAATNYISMVTMVLEFPASSGVIPTFCILTFRLYSGTKEMLISHFIFILMTMLFTVRECRFLYRVGCKYFVEFWNLVEVALILFSVIEIGFFFYKDHLVKLLLERMPAKKPQTFINFQFASYWDLTHVYIVSLIVFFVTLKFIKLLRFNRHISLLSSTLKAAWYPLSMFFIMFSIVMCSVVTTSRIVFGSLLDGYQNYFKAIASIISLLLGKFSYSQFQNANGFLGPIFFFGFNIMVNWVVMNIFLTILNDAFTDVREELQFQQNEYEIVDFITEHFKAWLGWSSPKNNVENTPTNQNLNSTVSENNDHYNVTRLQKTVLTNNESTAKFDDCLSITNQQWEMKNKSHKVSRPNKVKENSDPVESDCAISIRISELSKYDYLLNEGSLDVYASELLGKFIYCINYVYKANEAMGEKKDLGKRQFKKKVYSNSNLVIINSKNREVFKDLV